MPGIGQAIICGVFGRTLPQRFSAPSIRAPAAGSRRGSGSTHMGSHLNPNRSFMNNGDEPAPAAPTDTPAPVAPGRGHLLNRPPATAPAAAPAEAGDAGQLARLKAENLQLKQFVEQARQRLAQADK